MELNPCFRQKNAFSTSVIPVQVVEPEEQGLFSPDSGSRRDVAGLDVTNGCKNKLIFSNCRISTGVERGSVEDLLILKNLWW
jgi:hypothetical protein